MGRLKKAVAVAGATTAFMMIFSMITFILGFVGLYITSNRTVVGLVYGCYGGCLFFFVLIPLFVVGGGIKMLDIPEERAKGICAVGGKSKHDAAKRLKYLGSATADEKSLTIVEKFFVRYARNFDRVSERFVDYNMCTETCPCMKT